MRLAAVAGATMGGPTGVGTWLLLQVPVYIYFLYYTKICSIYEKNFDGE